MPTVYQQPDPQVHAPAFSVPAHACDCHAHIFGPEERYPTIPDARFANPKVGLADYRRVLRTLGIERAVLVQPHVYGADNRCLADALAQFEGRARGVGVIGTTVADAELDRMHRAGFRGVRINLRNAGGLALRELALVAERIKPWGWHIEFAPDPQHLPAIARAVREIDVDVVIPHLGRVAADAGVQSPEFQALLGLVRDGRCWVKLSGAHRVSRLPYPHPDVAAFADALIEAAGERMLWASDWPHTSVPVDDYMPNDGDMLDLLAAWVPDEKLRQRILVDNPARLYGFDTAVV